MAHRAWNRLWSDSEEVEIKKIYESGLSSSHIAKIYKCDKTTVLAIVRRQNGSVHPSGGKRGFRHSDETRARMSRGHRMHPTRYWLGRKQSEESNQRRSKSLKRHYRTHSAPMKGRTQSRATRRKISKAQRGHPPTFQGLGADNPNWQGGISRIPYPFGFNEDLKEAIRQRDQNTCRLCGSTRSYSDGRRMCVHHIDYDKNNLNPRNLISLCASCNSKANASRATWTWYFTNLQTIDYERIGGVLCLKK